MNGSGTYALQETIQGVTYKYSAPGQDPMVVGVGSKVGDFEEVLLWVAGDNPVLPVLDAFPVTSTVVSIFTYKTKKWWRYTIDTTDQTWTRINEAGIASPSAPVTDLLTKIDDGKDKDHRVTKVQVCGPKGEYACMIHPGTTCTLTYNPATRKYTLVCVEP